jgi:transposase-like protein
VELIVSDDHLGLKAARNAVFGGVPWQRCQFHLQQNAQAYVPRQSMKAEVAEDLRRIFNAPNRSMAEMNLSDTIRKFEKAAPRFANWMEHNVPEGLTVFHSRQSTSDGSEPRICWSGSAGRSNVGLAW